MCYDDISVLRSSGIPRAGGATGRTPVAWREIRDALHAIIDGRPPQENPARLLQCALPPLKLHKNQPQIKRVGNSNALPPRMRRRLSFPCRLPVRDDVQQKYHEDFLIKAIHLPPTATPPPQKPIYNEDVPVLRVGSISWTQSIN